MDIKDEFGPIVTLNVGGQRFSTSKSTLTWIPDTFFTSLLSGRIRTAEDDTGAKFIDRDPQLFRRILNYLRTKQVDLSNISVKMLLHEAEFYGISPLVRRLMLCEEMNRCQCGDILFHGMLPKTPAVCRHEKDQLDTLSSNAAIKLPHSKQNVPVASSSKMPAQKSNEDELFKSPCKCSKVQLICAHHNTVVVAYSNFVCCYKMKECFGWQQGYISPHMDSTIKHVAFLSKFPTQASEKMLAVALENRLIHLWLLESGTEAQLNRKVGVFNLNASVDELFFIGNQLVALSWAGKVGVWHAMTQNWQVQDMVQISCYDTAGTVLLLGCTNGSIYYIDMMKFPLRIKDNDLLVTELYRDPNLDTITAISVYLTPKTNICGNWIEIAYGTKSGSVRVIVQHPETVGHGPQLFQTYNVHNSPITRVALTTNSLISLCNENHIRTWTRHDQHTKSVDACSPGPFGDQDGEQIFVQRVLTNTDTLFIRLASTGERLCTIKSIDGLVITAFYVHECEGSNRMGARRRFLFTGLENGTVQIWDLTTAFDQYSARSQINQLNSTMQLNPEAKAQSSLGQRISQQLSTKSNQYAHRSCEY
ncbi:BTB domain-containing protein [Aphelenchoides bicaudatus]|nr:BTB domain-containing protein [Aphelenchoides bicaudatus]